MEKAIKTSLVARPNNSENRNAKASERAIIATKPIVASQMRFMGPPKTPRRSLTENHKNSAVQNTHVVGHVALTSFQDMYQESSPSYGHQGDMPY